MTKTKTPPELDELGASDEFVFNGIDGSTGDYLTPRMSAHQIAEVAKGGKLEAAELSDLQNKTRRARQLNYATVEGVDPNDLGQAGWAVVFPAVEEGSAAAREQAAIREALAPLLARRRAQASALGNEHYYQEYTGERGYRRGETKQQFLARLGAGPGPANPEKVPYYLLLVGDPDQIPYRIQYQLDVQYAVGRIHFDAIDDYATYARSVVEAETGQVERARRASFFGVCCPDDRATQLSHAYLVKPLADYIEQKVATEGWPVERVLAEAATHGRLAEIYRDAPALLFTASHGMGFPNGHDRQRAYQGAFLCQDWGGPKSKLERGHYFAGEDIDRGADLRGMIGVHFACYGMGTPRHDDFAKRAMSGGQRREIAPASFVARLPQAMLANPGGGALAAIGHVDRAWGSSFLWIDAQGKQQTQKHLDVFESAVLSLLQGKRVGYALEYFDVRYAELASDLSARVEEIQMYEEEHDDNEIAQMWIFNNDARNYAVVGDPAVRLFGADELAGTGGDRGAPEIRGDEGRAGAAPAEPGLEEAGEVTSYSWFGGKDEPGLLARFGSKVTETLGQVVADAVTLEVKTYVSRDMRRVATGKGALAEEAGAELRAYTRCSLDGDTEACVPVNREGEIDQALWALHSEMVEQAQAHRNELIKTVLSVLGSLTGK